MVKMNRKSLVIILLIVGGVLFIVGFLHPLIYGIDFREDNISPLGFVGITLMIMSGSFARDTNPQNFNDTIQKLKNEFNILNIIFEDGEAAKCNIGYGGKEYEYLGFGFGYTPQDALKIIRKNANKCSGKVVLVRHTRGNDTMYDDWYVYVSP